MNNNSNVYSILIACSGLVFVLIISGYLKRFINYIFCRNENEINELNRV